MPAIIQSNPNVLGGIPVIKGTRIPVARIMALRGLNYTLTDIKKELPQLIAITAKDLKDIFRYYAKN